MDDQTGRANHIEEINEALLATRVATRATGHREHCAPLLKNLRLMGTGIEAPTIATTETKTLHRQADTLLNQVTSGMIVLDIYNQVTQMIT